MPEDLWPAFQEAYGEFITAMENVNADPITASELMEQAKRMWSGGAAGLDGWKPAEYKLLPLAAWQARRHVEMLFTRTGRLPDIYYDVPISMLRKGDGLVPLQHRGISVFTASYRMIGCCWWHRIIPSFLQWVHPAASGGLPGRECMESAWDAQLAFEQATLKQEGMAAILLDYEKFFDKFDCNFFMRLFQEIGMPPAVCTLFDAMYSNIRRRLKISGHLSTPLDSTCGAGQGDSFSLLGALAITTIEFRMLDARWPNVLKGCVVDDRNLVGKVLDVLGAARDCLRFDRLAGLFNNIPKFLGMANNPGDRRILAAAHFGGHPLKVTDETALVGLKGPIYKMVNGASNK